MSKHRGERKGKHQIVKFKIPKLACDTCESNNLDCVNMTKAIVIKKRQITCADIQASRPFFGL